MLHVCMLKWERVKEALDCLENSYTAGLTQLGWFENDSDLDNLRKHPRFSSIVGTYALND